MAYGVLSPLSADTHPMETVLLDWKRRGEKERSASFASPPSLGLNASLGPPPAPLRALLRISGRWRHSAPRCAPPLSAASAAAAAAAALPPPAAAAAAARPRAARRVCSEQVGLRCRAGTEGTQTRAVGFGGRREEAGPEVFSCSLRVFQRFAALIRAVRCSAAGRRFGSWQRPKDREVRGGCNGAGVPSLKCAVRGGVVWGALQNNGTVPIGLRSCQVGRGGAGLRVLGRDVKVSPQRMGMGTGRAGGQAQPFPRCSHGLWAAHGAGGASQA